MNRIRVLTAAVVLIVAAFVFQAFFRYGYVTRGERLVRIDRLTQETCLVWLGPRPVLEGKRQVVIDLTATPGPSAVLAPLPGGYCQ
jgi:hypothetical protein